MGFLRKLQFSPTVPKKCKLEGHPTNLALHFHKVRGFARDRLEKGMVKIKAKPCDLNKIDNLEWMDGRNYPGKVQQ